MHDEEESNDSALTDEEQDSYQYDSEEEDKYWREYSEDEIPICDRHVLDSVDLGKAINFAFPVEMEYDISEESHMFDEELSDESSLSDLSSNYEELTDLDMAACIVVVKDNEEQDGRGMVMKSSRIMTLCTGTRSTRPNDTTKMVLCLHPMANQPLPLRTTKKHPISLQPRYQPHSPSYVGQILS